MRIISIDPGVMTGYCYAELVATAPGTARALSELEQVNKLKYHPFQAADDVDDLWRRLKRFDPEYIIIEDFEFRRGKAGAAGLNLFPKELIGVTRLYDLLTNARVFVQKAAQGKSYYTNPILQGLGLYRRGIPHGMDASRHLLQWCMFGFGNQFIGKQRTEDFAQITQKLEWWADANE